MRSALAPLAALLAGVAAALLLVDARMDANAQGKGGAGGGNVQCSVDSVTAVAFGNYDTASPSAATSTGQLNFSCKPQKQTVSVKISIGPSGVSGSIADRALREAGGADTLHYNLFHDQRGSIVWGDDLAGGTSMVVTGQGTFSVEIYGVVQPLQPVAEGIYADALQITIQP
jgi:spore coat protein U-like protein